MRTAAGLLSAAALAGLAASSPAPQQLDFNQLAAAPTVQTAPVLNGISNQTVTISSSAIAQSISAAVSTTATAVSTAPAQVVNKRSVEKRDLYSWWNCFWFGYQCGTSSSAATTTSSTVKSTSTSSTKTSSSSSSKAVSTSSSSSSSSKSSSSSSSAAASSTSSGSATVNTVSGTSSSTTACPTTPEEGTYCGFINPEDPCAPQPDGYGPKVTPDTVSAFLAYAPFHSMASAAPTVVPSNNTAVGAGNAYQQTFLDLNASSSANSYLGLYTLTSYSVADCAAHCDSTSLCTAFNIYIERDPSQNPSKNDSTAPTVWGYYCPNPSSITNYKCTLWGSNLDASTATNQGGWREDFDVVVTASNGYDATNTTLPPNVIDTTNSTSSATSVVSSVLSSATPVSSSSTSSSAVASATASSGPTWSSPKTCGGKAINAPNYWMGSKFYPGPFNPQVCADYASYQHALNKQAAIAAGQSYFTPCNSFNAYYLHKNGIPHGTYCALYDASISTSYATYTGGWSGNDKYDCRQSYQYTRQTLDQGRC
ncbi:hypothetical protein KCU98_g3438, partial [Aureobasidium melanogenum]